MSILTLVQYLGENTDSQDFDTAEQAQAFLDDIMQKDHVKKAWFSTPYLTVGFIFFYLSFFSALHSLQ